MGQTQASLIQLQPTTAHVVLYGDDDFRMEQALHQLRDELIDPNFGALNHKIIRNPSIAECIEACAGIALGFGAKSIVEIHNPQFLEKAVKDPTDEKQLIQLQDTINAVDTTQKLCIWIAPKLDSRIKMGKWLLGQKRSIQAIKLERIKYYNTQEAISTLLQLAKSQSIAIEQSAATFLVENWGTDLRLLNNELQKLAIFALDKPITVEMAKALSAHNDNIFLMVDDWLLQQNMSQNIQTLKEVLLTEHPQAIIARTQSYLSNIFKSLYYFHQGLRPQQIAEKTSQSAFVIEKHIQKFRSVQPQRLKLAKAKLLELDTQPKFGQLDAHLGLETLLAL